jgi:hypothetical protein
MKVVSAEQAHALAILAADLPDDAYLAGGVAIAMRLGHRTSRDLDLFTVHSDPADIADRLVGSPEVRITSRSSGTVYLELGGVPVSIIRHRYPLLAPAERMGPSNVPVAALEDLTAMKLQAIATRGAARDFWDLHQLIERRAITLERALEEHGRRYAQDDPGHVVRSLAYFGDAEAAPLPLGLTRERWRALRADFEQWVRAL